MNTLKWFAAGILTGIVVVAFRDFERGRWLAPAVSTEPDVTEREPLLGYDGMDQETLLAWLDDATLDEETIQEILHYERTHRDRAPVLEALEEMLT